MAIGLSGIYTVETSAWASSSAPDKKSTVSLAIYAIGGSDTVDWKLILHTSYTKIVVGELSVKFDNKAIYYRSPDQKKEATNGEVLASGTAKVDSDSIDVYVGAGIYEWAINVSAIDTINFASSIPLIVASFGTGTIGEKCRIILNGYSSRQDPITGLTTGRSKATLRYKVGNIEGTIVENHTSAYYDWIVPTLFYEIFPHETYGTGTIYCDTYGYDGEFVGTNSKSFGFYVVDHPTLDPTVVDVDAATLALTGDANTFVRFFSDAKYEFNATPGNGTSLTDYKLECGPQTGTKSAGTLTDVESGTFKFMVTDGRGYTKTKTVEKNFIPYVKLTCNIWRKSATADGTIQVGIGGDIFSSSFGAVRNTLRISYRVKEGSGEFSEWQSIDYLNDDATYEVTVTLENLDYRKTYTFEAMAEDKLMTVVSRQLPVHCVPVYDWGRDDFNVNVNFNMNHQTVLRHNHVANNVVLSASGGFIYFRPKGTEDTSAEVKISPQGNIELTGDILINGQSLKSLLGIS